MLTSSTNTFEGLTQQTDIDKLDKHIESIITGALPYYISIFKQMFLANPQNATLLYNFLLTEQNEKNVKLGTKNNPHQNYLSF